jgi:assimilatory nitrate reductase catalytic subunit
VIDPTGSATTIKTHCPYCAFQCGMTMRRKEANAAAFDVQADPTFPVNLGRMCIKGFTSAELLTHPSRLLTPQVRASDGHLRTASWEAALDFIAERLLQLRSQYGANALAAFGSGALTNEKAYLLGKFVRVALKSAMIDYNGRFCMSSAAAGQNRAFGLDRGLPFAVEDIARTGTLLLWGANCADTMPPIMQWIDQQRAGGKLIVVDPRRSETARVAHEYVQLTPGTDLALANGLLNLAIEEGLCDQEYIAERTVGFDDVRRTVIEMVPAHVERLTGVSIEQQVRLVRMLADAPTSMVLSGRGAEQQSKGSDTVSALINLMLALGKVGKAASGYGCLTGQGNGQGGREHGQKADQLPGYRLIENPADRAAVAKVWGVDPSELPGKGKSAQEMLESLGPSGGIRALLVFGSNVAVAAPDAGALEKRLRTLDLLVVCDAFANETSQAAHVLLPVTQWAEEEGTMTNLEGRVIRRRQVKPPPSGVRSDIDVLCGLAKRLGEQERFAFASPREVFEEFRRATAGGKADYSGITYERIDRDQGVYWPCPEESHPGTPRLFQERFAHPDGRARFIPVRHRPAAEIPDRDYPFFFTTGRYRERQVADLVEARPEPRAQIHPRLASRLGIHAGDSIVVESRRGSVTFAVDVSPGIREDTIFAPFHWGGALAANRLTIPALDPTSRMPEFKICAVRARAGVSPISEVIQRD